MFTTQNKQVTEKHSREGSRQIPLEALGKRVREQLEMLFRPEFLDLGLEGGLVLIGRQRTEKWNLS